MTRKVWLLSAALSLASACGDDDPDSPAAPNDGGRDSAVPGDAATADAGSINGSIDSGSIDGSIDSGSIDASIAPVDAAAPSDSALPTDSAVVAAIEIAGRWHDEQQHKTVVIDATTFTFGNLIEYDNATRVAIVQNKPDDEFGPNQFSKQVWTPIVDGSFFYCTVGFGLETLELARAANMPADASDPLNGGCGDLSFPWSKLVPTIEIAGSWLQASTALLITSDALGEATIESYDNVANSAVTSTVSAGPLPKFSKLFWTQPDARALYLCYTARDLSTAGEAADDTSQADSTQLATGCLGAAWTVLTLAP